MAPLTPSDSMMSPHCEVFSFFGLNVAGSGERERETASASAQAAEQHEQPSSTSIPAPELRPAACGILWFQFKALHPGSPSFTNVAMLKWISAMISPSAYHSCGAVGQEASGGAPGAQEAARAIVAIVVMAAERRSIALC